MATGRSAAWAGWIVFASTMMVVISIINIFQGSLALLQDEHLAVTPNNFYIVDTTSWGWTVLFSGLVLLVTGLGLFMAKTWARIIAIIVVGLHAVSQVAWLGAYPVWSLLMIALDTVVLFALTARWSQARADLNEDDGSYYGPYDGAPTAAHRMAS